MSNKLKTPTPRRLTDVLNDPSAEWAEIISAVEAKAQGDGTVINALENSISSTRKLDDHAAEQSMNNKATDSSNSDDEDNSATEDCARGGSGSADGDDKLMPLGNVNRRASLTSQSSIQRFSRRSLFRHEALRRQASRKRASLESVGKNGSSSSRSLLGRGASRSSGRSIRSGRSICSGRSITITPSFNCSTSSINSVNIMDFGVSDRALTAALDESRRSFASLDDDVLEELDEELYGDGNEVKGWGGSRRGLLLSWRENDDSSLRSIHNGGIDEPMRSEGDLDDYQDLGGFLDWPSVADGANDTIQEEEEPDPIKTPIKTEEEWNIEDYEPNFVDTLRSIKRRSGQMRFLSESLTKSLRLFDRSPSLESSFSSQEGLTDLIKQKLLSTKNKNMQQQQDIEVGENNDEKKRVPKRMASLASALRRSSRRSDTEETTKSQEAIWVRESDDSGVGVGEQYRNIYAAAAAKSPQTQKKNSFSYF